MPRVWAVRDGTIYGRVSIGRPEFNVAAFVNPSPDEHFRNGAQAVADARQACEMTGWKRADILDTLAAAYAETGDFEQAEIWQQKAIEQAADNPPFVKETEQR
jgi:hypothetical protein